MANGQEQLGHAPDASATIARTPSWLLYATCLGTFVALVAILHLLRFELLRFFLIFPAAYILSIFGFLPSDNMSTMLLYAVCYGILFFSPTLASGIVRTRWVVGIIAVLAVLHVAGCVVFLATFDMPVPG